MIIPNLGGVMATLTAVQAANTATTAARIATGGLGGVPAAAEKATASAQTKFRRFIKLFGMFFALVLCGIATAGLFAGLGAWVFICLGFHPMWGAPALGIPATWAFIWAALTVITE